MVLNKIIEMGRLTVDPELKSTASGISVLSFNIAVNKPYNKEKEHPEANFFSCVAWRGVAETISKFFKKGDRIIVEGILQSRKYDANDGTKRTVIEIVVTDFSFVDKKTSDKPETQAKEDDKGLFGGEDGDFEPLDDDSMPF